MMLYSVPVLMASLEQREARRFNGSKNSEYFFNEKLAVRIITHSTQLVFPFYPISSHFPGKFSRVCGSESSRVKEEITKQRVRSKPGKKCNAIKNFLKWAFKLLQFEIQISFHFFILWFLLLVTFFFNELLLLPLFSSCLSLLFSFITCYPFQTRQMILHFPPHRMKMEKRYCHTVFIRHQPASASNPKLYISFTAPSPCHSLASLGFVLFTFPRMSSYGTCQIIWNMFPEYHTCGIYDAMINDIRYFPIYHFLWQQSNNSPNNNKSINSQPTAQHCE